MNKSSITGKTVFITGASSGIGKACAEQFASLGVHVILTARRLDRIQKIAEELSSKYGIKAIPIQLDVQKNNQVETIFQDLEKKKLDIDILLNNAGLALTTDLIQDGLKV